MYMYRHKFASLLLSQIEPKRVKENSECKEHKQIDISQDSREEFWEHFKTYRGDHPACNPRPGGGWHNPVGRAGDDARYNLAGAKVIVVLLSLLLHNVQRLEVCRFPFVILRESLSLGIKSLDPIFRALVWSCNLAFQGAFPTRGPLGEDWMKSRRRGKAPGSPLHGGPYAVCELRGDWKWHRETFLFRRHYAANAICMFCNASKRPGENQFTNFLEFEKTGFHPFSTAEFFQRSLGRYISPLCMLVGFLPRMVALCSMHSSNLGLCAWLNAGALLGLLDRAFFGATTMALADRLKVVTLRFRRWCSALSIPQSQPYITIGMLHLSESMPPELTLKAYHARLFLAFMVLCTHTELEARRSRNETDDDLLLIFSSCSALADWHQLLEECPRYLNDQQCDGLRRLCYKFLKVYKTLALRHALANSTRFPLKPKHHAYQELVEQMCSEHYNCRHRHTYRDEDQLGQVKKIVRCVHKSLLEHRTLYRLQLRLKAAPADMPARADLS